MIPAILISLAIIFAGFLAIKLPESRFFSYLGLTLFFYLLYVAVPLLHKLHF